MSCRPREHETGREGRDIQKPSRAKKWEKIAAGFWTVMVLIACLIYASHPWAGESADAKKNWEQMRGNDGTFWKGSPDDSGYADAEGMRCQAYYQYFYDSDGRLSKKNTFFPHDYYEDVWVLHTVETYEYDELGRISRSSETSRNRQWVYEYTEEGYTKTMSDDDRTNGFLYTYDSSGNCVYFRNAVNFSFPRATAYEYDEKGRKIREILEVEGKPPYGTPPCVVLDIEYDDENYTSVGTEYDWDGEITYIWHNTYDQEWRRTESSWYAAEDIPEGYSAETCEAYYAKGYLASYSGGRLIEEVSNYPKTAWEGGYYAAYDYDGNGNCIMVLRVYGADLAGLERYVYTDGRLTEEYYYDMDDVAFWERQQADGSRLTLQSDGEEQLTITRTGADGALINRFVYGKLHIEAQDTPTETIYWQNSPSLMLAQNPQDEEYEPGGGPDGEGQPETEGISGQETFFYTVEPGDCLWRIAEKLLGDGQKYWQIYQQNRDVIGPDPGLLLPGVELYMETDERRD